MRNTRVYPKVSGLSR